MTFSTTEITHEHHQVDEIRQTAYIRKEAATKKKFETELKKIGEQIDDFKSDDHLTHLINEWYTKFDSALKKANPIEPICKTYIKLLQDLLIEPLFQTPLDDECYLGSDNHTYSHKALCIFLNALPEAKRSNSPLGIPLTKDFEVNPHTLARFMINWLKDQKALNVSEPIEKDYASINQKKIERLIPNRKNNQRRQINRIQARRMEQASNFEKQKRKAEEEQNQTFRSLHERLSKFESKVKEELDEFEENSNATLNNIQNKISECDEDIKQLDLEIKNIDKKINQVDSEITELQHTNLQLRQEVKELEKEIKERDRGSLTSVLVTVAAVVGTIVLSVYMPGMAAAIIPVAGGGAKVTISKKG